MRYLLTAEMMGQAGDSYRAVPEVMEAEMTSTLGEYTVARIPVEARSSRPDATTRGGRKRGFGWQRLRSSGHHPRLRIPERKQVNRDQAFVIASSLWPFRWGNPRRSGYPVKAVRTHKR